jgi:hypothetical protein
MQPETLTRFFLECIAVLLIGSGFIFEDKIITMEQKIFKKIIGGFRKWKKQNGIVNIFTGLK